MTTATPLVVAKTAPPTGRVTFAELCRLEPQLAALERAVTAVAGNLKRKRNRCANGVWYGYGRFPSHDFKRRMSALVGAHRWARHPDPAAQELLSSCAAYDAAYEHLYHLLPDCRNCGCL